MTTTTETCHITNVYDVRKEVVFFKSVSFLARCKKHMFDEVPMKRKHSSAFKLLIITSLSLSWMPDLAVGNTQLRITTDTYTWGEAISAQRTTITQSHETICHTKNNFAAIRRRVRIRTISIRRLPRGSC